MDGAKSPVEGAVTTAATAVDPELKSAVEEVLDHVREWDYEDRGYDYSSCPSCGWNTKDDRTDKTPMGHRVECRLRAAMDRLEGLVGR